MLFAALLLTACYNHRQRTPDAWDLTRQQIDSISFSTTHHYTQNYNFVVNAPSLPLADALPETAFDTLYVTKGERIVVAEIETVPTDTIDSVWVKVARDQYTQGWIRECDLLQGVSPDDPISQFIDFFSDAHLLIFLALCAVVGAAYAIRLMRHNAYIVHFNDIDSFYPTLLCLLVASSAALYATIQTFWPESWRHFYYHPSLNPFSLPAHLGIFTASQMGETTLDLHEVSELLEPLLELRYILAAEPEAPHACIELNMNGIGVGQRIGSQIVGKEVEDIAGRIREHAFNYKTLYTDVYDRMEGYAKTSLQSTFLKGLKTVSKATGEAIGKTPVISKGKVDEALIDAGSRLGEIDSKRTLNALLLLRDAKDDCVRPFVENIDSVNRLYNRPIEMVFDQENIYLGSA